MVLMKPGCWHDTVWADRSWPIDQWLEYGAAVTGADSSHYYYGAASPPRIDDREFILLMRDLLEAYL